MGSGGGWVVHLLSPYLAKLCFYCSGKAQKAVLGNIPSHLKIAELSPRGEVKVCQGGSEQRHSQINPHQFKLESLG